MIEFIGAPGTIRTSDPQIRSLVLYPAELRAPLTLREGEPKALETWRDKARKGLQAQPT
jgi:hypothetical protein